jgi:type I restriction enzyme, S subunit
MSWIKYEVPAGWTQVRIDEIAEIKSGSTPLRAKGDRYFRDGTIGWVKTMDLTNGPITETDEKITCLAVQESSCPMLEPGTVLVAMYGGFNQIGRTGIMRFRGTINQAISALVVCKDYVYSEYLLYWLNQNLLTWRRVAASSRKDPNITRSDVAGFPVLLPPLPEQRKIAQILSTWDEAIATVDALIAALQRRKQGLMQRLLTGQVRFGEFAARPWRKATLGDFVEPVNRSESILPDRDYRLLGVRWYLQGAHIHNIVAGSSIVTKTLNRVESGDILYNKMWVSKNAFAVAKDEHHGSYGSNEYPQFRAKNGLNVEYIEQAFHNGRFLHDATALCRGTTGRIRLNPEDFLQLVLSLPEQDEQDRIADVLISAQEEISAMSAYLAQLRQQKKGLMQRLLTGQVRVNVGEEMQ